MLIDDFIRWEAKENKKIIRRARKILRQRANNKGVLSAELEAENLKLAFKHYRYKGYIDGYIAGLKCAIESPDVSRDFLENEKDFIEQISDKEENNAE